MELSDYFLKFKDSRSLTLIGPLCSVQVNYEEPVIFVDGGVRSRVDDIGISVGDGDSSGQKLDIQLDTRKDFSDLCYVLENIPEYFSEIHLLGFLGGRQDHELINLGEVCRFLSKRKYQTQVLFNQDVRGYSSGDWSFSFSGTFSLVSFEDNNIEIQGDSEYTFKGILKAFSSQGLSNIGGGYVQFKCSKPILIFYNKDDHE